MKVARCFGEVQSDRVTRDAERDRQTDTIVGVGGRGGDQDANHVVEFARSAASDAAQILVTMGDTFTPGGSKPAARGAVRLRIERRRNEYTFHLWNPQTRVWEKIDRQQPQFDPKIDRRIGLAAVGGAGVVYTFSGFSVRLL